MRSGSQSLKVTHWLQNYLKSLDVDTIVLDLHELNLPMFTDEQEETEAEQNVLKALDSADGVVFVSPEWNGTMSHGLVNMLHYVGTELAHKPVTLVGVSSGRGGHYPLMQMRIMNYKNTHFVVSPESFLVQDVKKILNDDDMSDDAQDASIKKRARYALNVLLAYARALHDVRESGVVDHKNFPNGV